MAVVDLPEPDVKLDLYQGTSGTYAGLDRFGRVKDQYWDGYGTTADVDRFKYGHDDAGNRTYRDIDSAIYSTDDKDQAYSYDGLHRLTNADEGTLSGETISGTPAQEEDYTLDALGNWSGYVTKTAGTADLDQSRTHNDVNEITDVSETTGPSWITPAHDAAGNMTTVPQPADLTSSYTATYDAFNRLVKLEDGANTVAEYEYDGLNRRIVNSVYAGGSLDHRQHVYYNEQWQALEVRKETGGNEDADPLQQSVWHPYYVDALLLRDYDEDVDGTSVRHYYAQDANFNVTAVTDDTGSVVERYHYTPYGQLKVLDADFSDDADGASDISNATTFTGRRYDAESGLYYYRNRFYHAAMGRFASRDPILYEGSQWNLYEYAKSTPLNMADPNGLGPGAPQCGYLSPYFRGLEPLPKCATMSDLQFVEKRALAKIAYYQCRLDAAHKAGKMKEAGRMRKNIATQRERIKSVRRGMRTLRLRAIRAGLMRCVRRCIRVPLIIVCTF